MLRTRPVQHAQPVIISIPIQLTVSHAQQDALAVPNGQVDMFSAQPSTLANMVSLPSTAQSTEQMVILPAIFAPQVAQLAQLTMLHHANLACQGTCHGIQWTQMR